MLVTFSLTIMIAFQFKIILMRESLTEFWQLKLSEKLNAKQIPVTNYVNTNNCLVFTVRVFFHFIVNVNYAPFMTVLFSIV